MKPCESNTKELCKHWEKRYVKPVVFTEPQPEAVWYLSHHPVCNAKKPGKVRRVANAASSFRGQSPNDNLLSGPDLLQNLFILLLRFRERPVAVIADIEALFMQISITEKDQAALRFLWLTGNSIDPPIPVHTFDIRCCLFSHHCYIRSETISRRFCCRRCGHKTVDSRRILHGRFSSFFPQHQ